jgi:hypothetical protein
MSLVHLAEVVLGESKTIYNEINRFFPSMYEGKEILGFLLSNWKTLVRWVLRIPAQPEITVDELKEQLSTGDPPVLIDVRSLEEYEGRDETYKYGHSRRHSCTDI